jgi:hypothetical protein
MAVTPREALGAKPNAEIQEIYAIELQIDRKLKTEYNGRDRVNIEFPPCSDYVRRTVLKLFADAGWKIGLTTHRDETIYHFESAD